jgi:hypothetical protein
MRRCSSCRRRTPHAALTEAHLPPTRLAPRRLVAGGQPGRVAMPGPHCPLVPALAPASPRHPSRPARKEVIPLAQGLFVVGCVAAVLIVGIWRSLSDRPPDRLRRRSRIRY